MRPNDGLFWHLTYEEVDHACTQLSQAAPFYPDLIVAIARGGLIPASLVYRHFPKAEFMVLKAKSYTGIFKQQKVRISPFPWKALKGKQVLFVDDVLDTGNTWRAIKDRIPRNVSFELSTVVSKQQALITTALRCDPKVWVHFPWEGDIK